jgi:hypothetical protein
MHARVRNATATELPLVTGATIGHHEPMEESPEQPGRRLVQEMRTELPPGDVEAASDLLRWGADDLDDDEVWAALLAALEEVQEDGEYWSRGDGLVDESVRTRPALDARCREARSTNAKAAEVYRVMQDPPWNWTNPESWGE